MFSSNSEFLYFVDNLLLSFNFSSDVRHFICCQSALETGFGTSRICLHNCNLFGMKLPVNRLTTASGSSFGHAIYSSYFDSVLDYVLWLSFSRPLRHNLKLIDDYASHLLRCHYAKDKDYISKIKYLYSQYYG